MIDKNYTEYYSTTDSSKTDEYETIISNILQHSEVQKMQNFTHHRHVTCLEHSLHVSYISYCICKKFKLDYRSAARGGLLHDFFLYDWRTLENKQGMHAFAHPFAALKNAKKHFEISAKEEDIIVKHMWPVTVMLPRYKESFLITVVDKYCAVTEALGLVRRKKLEQLKAIPVEVRI